MKWFEDIHNYLVTNLPSNLNKNVFIYELPMGQSSPSILILPPSAGVVNDKEISGFYKADFSVIVQDVDQESAYDVAIVVMNTLTIRQKVSMNISTYKAIVPTTLPIVFPRLDSDNYEASVNFETYFTFN